MFEIKTDNKIKSQIDEMKENVEKLSSYFEKGNSELTAIEYSELNLLINGTKKEFNQLIKDVYSRIESK